MKTSDLSLLISVSSPTLHPDGTWAVIATSRPDLDADSYVGQLWRVPVEAGAAPVRITRGFRDSAPQFSPDGERIAFLRSDGESPAQLHVIPAGGGEAVAATDQKLGVSEFEWSPDGANLLYVARVADEGRYGTVKDLAATAEPPRRIVTRNFRHNGVGYTNDRRTHLFMVGAPDPAGEPSYRRAASAQDLFAQDPAAQEPSAQKPSAEMLAAAAHSGVPESRQLTSGDYDHSFARFSPNGDRVGFLSAQHADRDIDLANNIYELTLDTAGAEPVAVITADAHFGVQGFAYASDSSIYFIGVDFGQTGRDFVGRSGVVHRVDRSGGTPLALTDPERCDFTEGAHAMKFGSHGEVLALNRWRGSVELVSVSALGEVSTLVGGAIVVDSFDSASGHTVVGFHGPQTHGDLGLVLTEGLQILTDFSAPLVSAGISPAVELTVSARDGQEIQGWVLTPSGEGPHPVLLNIHGGPHAQYTCGFFDEAQVYVDAGYAVVMCNPRGAAGYGETFARAIKHAMGTRDYTDVLDYLDGAIAANPSFDPERVGIMGGSYGGYLTAWTIAHDHRFAAAIVERGFLDPVTFVGTSDIGDFFSDEYTGTDPEKIKAQSPQAFVHQVTTPTFVVHSENDLRCPMSQAERYYLALKRHGVETELLIFPGETHELTRSGQPRHRAQRFDAVLEWWQRYLPVRD